MYDHDWWLAKALAVDLEHYDVQVEFFHPHGPNVSVQQKKKKTTGYLLSAISRYSG